jgi:hypothetical protein
MTKRVLAIVVAVCSLLVVWGPAPAGASPAVPERASPASNVVLPAAPFTCAHISGNHPNHPVVGFGSQGPDVLEVQCRVGIWAEGHSRGCCGYDGSFGSGTRRKVMDIQAWCRAWTGRTEIAVDGVVGPVTWRMLHAFSCWA